MRPLLLIGLLTSSAFAGIPDDELLSSARITRHTAEFEKIEIILGEAGFRRANYAEVADPTRHFESYEEWVYYVQPIFETSKNELLIGFDPEGQLRLSASQSLAPLCECPGDQLYRDSAAKMDKALQTIAGRIFGE